MRSEMPLNTNRSTEQIVAIRSAKAAARERLLTQFLQEREQLFRQIVQRCRFRSLQVDYNSNHEGIHFDDLLSIVTQVASTLALSDWDPDAGYRFESALMARARSQIGAFSASGASHGLSGMSGHVRRSRSVAMARQKLLVQLQREPTDDEILAAQHESIRGRKNVRKQGASASSADLQTCVNLVYDPHEMWQAASAFQGSGFEEVESKDFINRVVNKCNDDDPELGRFARAWLEGIYDGERPSAIAAELGVDPQRARTLISHVRRLAMRMWSE